MTKKKFDKKCKNCGKTFTAMNVKKLYCSEKCGGGWKKMSSRVYRLKCKYCKGTFSTHTRTDNFCSKKCRAKNKSKRNDVKYDMWNISNNKH